MHIAISCSICARMMLPLWLISSHSLLTTVVIHSDCRAACVEYYKYIRYNYVLLFHFKGILTTYSYSYMYLDKRIYSSLELGHHCALWLLRENSVSTTHVPGRGCCTGKAIGIPSWSLTFQVQTHASVKSCVGIVKCTCTMPMSEPSIFFGHKMTSS